MFRAIKTAAGPDVSRNFKTGDLVEDLGRDVGKFFDAGAVVPVERKIGTRINPNSNKTETFDEFVTDQAKLEEMQKASDKRKPKPEPQKAG